MREKGKKERGHPEAGDNGAHGRGWSRAPGGSPAPRRGSILLAVMVVVVLAALVGTTVLYRADAQRGSAMTVMEHAQLRALAWSGVQGAMAELQSQRGELLAGGEARLTSSWNLYTGSSRGSVRLAAIGPRGAAALSEAGKLDVNLASAAMLARLPGVGDSLAARIVTDRGPGLASPEELARVDGLGAEVLFGEQSGGGAVGSGREESGAEAADVLGLLQLTTVFSFDPNTAPGPEDVARVDVSGGWSADVEARLRGVISDGAFTALQAALKGGAKPTKDSEVIGALRSVQAPVETWSEILDNVTTVDDQFRRGRVDVNAASAEVLACVPGIDRAAADKLVEARARVDQGARVKVTWPLKEGILKEDQFQSAVDWIATRSLQWRVRVEARLERGEESASEEPTPGPPGMVWEAVIDASGTRARVAYLRDVTYLDVMARRARDQERAAPMGEAEPLPDQSADMAADKPRTSRAKATISELKTSKLELDSDLHFESMKGSGRLSMDTDLKLHGDKPAQDTGGAQAQPDAGAGAAAAARAMRDRRIGRWRAPSKE
jgi:DNA uptake protein ComE-like DNA-binding protein